MIKNNYEVEVLVNGKPLKEYTHERRVYIEGKEGSTFSLRLRNNSSERKLFVPSIDGLSVMNGEECSFDSSGYIVRPYSSIIIDGWRVSDAEVAEFYFSSPKDSYRKRKKAGNNLGVIGVAVFEEKEIPPKDTFINVPFPRVFPSGTPYPDKGIFYCQSLGMSRVDTRTVTTMASNNSMLRSLSQDIGTGWGSNKKSDVVSVEFERSGSPVATYEIFYNTRAQLEKLGVNFHKEPLYVAPQAFPGQYCKPPKD